MASTRNDPADLPERLQAMELPALRALQPQQQQPSRCQQGDAQQRLRHLQAQAQEVQMD